MTNKLIIDLLKAKKKILNKRAAKANYTSR